MRRIGPDNPGLSRVYAARILLLIIMAFLLAGAWIMSLIALGMHPLH